MLVIALRQLRGSYGLVTTGGRFEADEETAHSLLQRGLVRLPQLHAAARETKVVTPPETKPGRTRKAKDAR